VPDVVVVDASFATMWAIPEPHSARALERADAWARNATGLLAPCLLIAEVTNALYKRVVRREITLVEAQRALDIVLGFSIEIREEPGLAHRAMEWASRLGQPAAYDMPYLVLAELNRCECWTGDQRFFRSARAAAPWVHWVGEPTDDRRGEHDGRRRE
jgi:predicted nucleic acid-binding protein